VSTIGGDDSIRILPHLDLAVIADNPKVVVGYSDTTVVHMACARAGLGSFYGPSVMAGFGENGGVPGYLAEGVRRMLFTPAPAGRWPENQGGWTNELVDWHDPANQDRRRRRLKVPTGWRWLGGEEVGEGPLVAGCLEVLDWLRGTEWWPDLDGAVLAVETSEECPPPSVVGRFFRSLAASGDLARLRGVLVGRPGGLDLPVAWHEDYDLAIGQVIYGEQGRTDLPVVTGMDFGHTDPMWTLPIGATVRVDPATREVDFLTAGVA
jgi:muramoyltetrapeptide carboxypeptidase LdcA involved in peptidoglycan recycling